MHGTMIVDIHDLKTNLPVVGMKPRTTSIHPLDLIDIVTANIRMMIIGGTERPSPPPRIQGAPPMTMVVVVLMTVEGTDAGKKSELLIEKDVVVAKTFLGTEISRGNAREHQGIVIDGTEKEKENHTTPKTGISDINPPLRGMTDPNTTTDVTIITMIAGDKKRTDITPIAAKTKIDLATNETIRIVNPLLHPLHLKQNDPEHHLLPLSRSRHPI